MGQFGDQAYEPSADELIDVLKNLENLAAANPGLYRTIVEQIKVSNGSVANECESGRNTPNYNGLSLDLVNGSGSSYYEEVSSSQQQNGHSEQQLQYEQEQLQYEQELQYQQEQQ